MTIIYKHKEPNALEKNENTSDSRELYIDQQVMAELTFEMDKTKALELFNQLPAHVLPPLPHGHQWVKANNNYSIIRNNESNEHDILIVLYGPDAKQQINFICCVNNVTTYSFGHTKTGSPLARKYPMSNNDFRVPNYDYSTSKYNSHVRGHLIDHQDTINGASLSTQDSRNFVPEPPEYEWGMGFRNCKVKALRNQTNGGAYAQMNVYSNDPFITADGTKVPEDVRFYAFKTTNQYQAIEIYHVEFEENMKRAKGVPVLQHAKNSFISSLEAAPVVVPYSPDMSDRNLRYQVRAATIKEKQIIDKQIVSRFVQKDSLLAALTAGDGEFETSGRQLNAAIRAKNNKPISIEYAKRSLFFGESLSKLDHTSPFTSEDAKKGRLFFSDKKNNMDELADHFKQLCADNRK